MSLSYANALVLWNDDGELKIRDIHQDKTMSPSTYAEELRRYPYSGGAAYTVVREADARSRHNLMLSEMWMLVSRYNLSVATVHEAFCGVREYREQCDDSGYVPTFLLM